VCVFLCRAHPVLRREHEWGSVHTCFSQSALGGSVCDCFYVSIFRVSSYGMDSVCMCVHETLNYINEK
jgi:hypothetical protein